MVRIAYNFDLISKLEYSGHLSTRSRSSSVAVLKDWLLEHYGARLCFSRDHGWEIEFEDERRATEFVLKHG